MLFHFAGPGKETMWLIAFFWCMIRYYVYDMSHSRKHLRIKMVHWVIEIWTTHSFSSSLVPDNVLWIIAMADHFFGRCTNCTMFVWIVCNHKFMHVLSRHGATHLLLKIGPPHKSCVDPEALRQGNQIHNRIQEIIPTADVSQGTDGSPGPPASQCTAATGPSDASSEVPIGLAMAQRKRKSSDTHTSPRAIESFSRAVTHR